MEEKNELEKFMNVIKDVEVATLNLIKYRGNRHYRNQLVSSLKNLNRSYRFFKAKIMKSKNIKLKEKFSVINDLILSILDEKKHTERLEKIKELETFWPELEIEFEDLKLNIRSFDIPEEIPITEYRLDLDEAIKNFDNGCFVSSLVLCRRAYEGALVEFFKTKEKKIPIENIICKGCKIVIKKGVYKGITKLHKWAIENNLVTDRLRQVGFLLTDMGAGAAHPPLTQFPRNKELARLGITATIALLKELHSNKDN